MRARNSGQRAFLRGARTDSFEIVTAPQRSTPAKIAGLVFRLRAEITTALLLALAWVWLVEQVRPWVAGTILGALALVLAVVPYSRRYLTRRALAVETWHRLRAVLIQCRVINYDGNPPLLLWSRPTETGERVWVPLRAGLDLADLDHITGRIASGCFGWQARVAHARKLSALVRVDVIRRDPLATPVPLASRLADWLPKRTPASPDGGVVIPMQRPQPEAPVSVGREDVSDYV